MSWIQTNNRSLDAILPKCHSGLIEVGFKYLFSKGTLQFKLPECLIVTKRMEVIKPVTKTSLPVNL